MKQLKKNRAVKSLTIKGERAFLMNASGAILQEFSTKVLLEKNPTLKAKAFGCDVLIIHIYAPVSVRGGKGTRLFSWVEGAEALANARGTLSYAMVKGAYSYRMVKGSYSYGMIKGSYSLVQTPLAS